MSLSWRINWVISNFFIASAREETEIWERQQKDDAQERREALKVSQFGSSHGFKPSAGVVKCNV